jgi:hypothetical protein
MSLNLDQAGYIEFFDVPSDLLMRYIYPDQDHPWAGWLYYHRVSDNQWVSFRKATEHDLHEIHRAVKDVEANRARRLGKLGEPQ